MYKCSINSVFKVCPYCSMYEYFVSFCVWIIFHCMARPCFIHSSINQNMDCVLVLVMDSVSVNVCVYVFMWCIFISFDYICINRSGIAKSSDNPMFNLLRGYQTIIHSNSTILQSCQQCMRIPAFPHPNTCYFLFDRNSANECEMVSPCGFLLHFPDR